MAAAALPSATRDIERAKDDLARQGLCLVEGALDDDLLTALRGRLVEQAAAEREAGLATLEDGGANQRVTFLVNKGDVFFEAACHPVARALMPGLLGDKYLLSALSANIAGRGGKRMVLHEDQCHPPKTPYPLVGNIIWMLDDFTAENGATLVVPGSHLSPARPDPRDYGGTVSVEGAAGTALVYDGRLWHATGENRTARPRHGLITYFCVPFMRQMENPFLGLDPDVHDRLSDEMRGLLGFEVWGNLGRVEGGLQANGSLVAFRRQAPPVGVLRPRKTAPRGP